LLVCFVLFVFIFISPDFLFNLFFFFLLLSSLFLFLFIQYYRTARGRSININWSRSVHPTALMMSCNQCDFPVVKSFLQQPGRANTRGQDKYKKTALMYACEHNTDASVAIIAEILSGEANFAARKSLLEMTDVCKWSSLHYAARSGVLARFPWNLLGGETRALNELKTDAVTEIGISLIHIASWNGHNDVLRLLLNHGSIPLADLGYRVDDESGVATKFIPNNLTTKRLTELDLALKVSFFLFIFIVFFSKRRYYVCDISLAKKPC